LETVVRADITSFNTTQLKQFTGIFRYSNFTSIIDKADPAIESNITTIKMSSPLAPTFNTSTKYSVKFNNGLYHPHEAHSANISSTGFSIVGNTNTLYLDDDGEGNLRTYYLVGTIQTYLNATAGLVDYTTGEVTINAITIDAVINTDDTITVTVIPQSNDIVPVRNQILEIDTTLMVVKGTEDTIATGSSNAGTAYTTTTSYS
jgi:hypothetical protein